MHAHHRSILENAAQLRAWHLRIHATLEAGDGAAHYAACRAFQSNFDRLAFPGGLQQGLQKLKQHDHDAIESAVRFLEADPHYFRSGYLKERLLHTLKRVPLRIEQQDRLAQCINRSVLGGSRRVFAAYARLAGVVHPPDLLVIMEAHRNAENPEVRRRAAQVLRVIRSRAAENRAVGRRGSPPDR